MPIINFSHYKGGVGKSTLTASVAVALKMNGLSVSILDLDGLQSSIYFNKLRIKNGHEPIECSSAETVDEIKATCEKFRDSEKILLIDSGGYDSDISRYSMLASDILITPVAPSMVELNGLQKYAKILKQISEKYEQPFKTNVVINNADIRSKGMITELRQYIQKHNTYLDLFETVIYSRADYKKAYGAGIGVTELDNSKASIDIQQFVIEIQKELE